MERLGILGILMMILLLCNSENLNFFQNEYDVTLDIGRCTWFNSSYFKFVKVDFVLYNRTTRVLNASWQLLVNTGKGQLADVQVYKFSSNEYRFFPITVRLNICAEYTKNSFSFKDLMSKLSTNYTPCNMTKGTYYIKNAIPDFSRFPPHMPRGSYKVVVNGTHHSSLLYTLEFYGQIKDRPVDWRNIPKRNWN